MGNGRKKGNAPDRSGTAGGLEEDAYDPAHAVECPVRDEVLAGR